MNTDRSCSWKYCAKYTTVYLTAHAVLNPQQFGCKPNSGTEDSLMAVINAIEDNHEFQTELHITSFDKKKAFDALLEVRRTMESHRR